MKLQVDQEFNLVYKFLKIKYTKRRYKTLIAVINRYKVFFDNKIILNSINDMSMQNEIIIVVFLFSKLLKGLFIINFNVL